MTRINRAFEPISRRSFFRRAAMVAAGSALSTPLMSCGDTEVIVPCLGPAAAPTPVAGMTYIHASEIGCALDCDLNTGRNKYHGGPATDDAPLINAAMAAATADHPITLILDGGALISGLYMPADGYWSIAGLGCGTGFFIKTGANSDGIHNGPREAGIPNNPGPPVPPRGQNVSLSNFAINGNAGNGHNGDSTDGTRMGGWYFCVNLMNLDNITIRNVVAVNSPSFHFRFANCGHVYISGCLIESPNVYNDGLHFDGPANNVTIDSCQFATGDDSIAFNCPEGNGGDISDVTVTNCKFSSFSLLRLYTTGGPGSPAFRVNNVSVSNCTGTLTEDAFMFGVADGSLPNSIDNVTISDCMLTAPVLFAIAENFGSISIKNVAFTPNAESIWFRGPQVNENLAFLRPSPPYGGITWVGSQLTITNCSIIRNQNTPFTPFILASDSQIENLQFDGFGVQGNLPPLSPLIDLVSGAIGQLVFDALSSKGVLAPVGPGQWGSVTTVNGQGTGVLATNWPIPDSVMANNVPYISAATGLPSIKINGVVQLYSGQ